MERPDAPPAPAQDDPSVVAPLAQFAGQVPPAPAWFVEVMATEPRRSFVDAQGAAIEALQWGDPTKPGLLLLHGMSAHADWWDFVAPMLTDRYHVVAMSWSGMGRSGWRESYGTAVHVDEALAVMEATGLFAKSRKPIIAAHSFGGRQLLGLMARAGERLQAGVVIDAPLFPPHKSGSGRPRSDTHVHRIYPTQAAALARFRFAPAQRCDNLFIADHLARHSLARLEQDGVEGWSWRFDPAHRRVRLQPATPEIFDGIACPFGIITADRSYLYDAENISYLKGLLPPGTPWRVVRDAAHHLMVDQPQAFVATLRDLLDSWA